MTPGRRQVRYESLDAIMPDVERLLAGHRTVGNWSVGQMCRHVGLILRASVDLPASTQFDPAMRFDEAKGRAALELGVILEGLPTGGPFVPPEGLDDREEAEGLRAAIGHYKAAPGPVISHPLLGPMSRPEWDRMSCHQAAHHLSFAVPE
jgi:hypothetical protein